MQQTPPPKMTEPLLLLAAIILAALGAIIGIQLITTLGISANTSILGALIAICVSRIPLAALAGFRDIRRQNLVQTAVSAATFGAANCLMTAIGIPWLMGMPELVWPMLLGAAMAMLVDATMLYRMFDSKVFPATGVWPAGVATAEALWAGDRGGKKALFLGIGIAAGVGGAALGVPMSAAGVALIGNQVALMMFGIGLLVRGYANNHPFIDVIPSFDVNALFIPHGFMIGAGLVALIQVICQIVAARKATNQVGEDKQAAKKFMLTLRSGFVAYLLVALLIAVMAGLYTEMSLPMLVGFLLFAAVAALIQETIVGIAAMYSGWFPAFAAALISLIIGMLVGFPPQALAMLVGFCAATGPAFADKGFDLKTGFLIRGEGQDKLAELHGRRQQYLIAMLGFAVAILMVALMYQTYFNQDLVAPASRAYASTIKAGTSPEVAMQLLIWAVPGALLQWWGGASRQLGVLFATGLLINYPIAGWTVLAALVVRLVLEKGFKRTVADTSSFAGGLIAGDALFAAAKMFIPLLKAKFVALFAR
jgi:uncharacterized oligopeptide transporter (OPT) family protein